MEENKKMKQEMYIILDLIQEQMNKIKTIRNYYYFIFRC